MDAGFRSLPAPDAEPQPEGDCRLPAGWNSRFKDVWAFEYRRSVLASYSDCLALPSVGSASSPVLRWLEILISNASRFCQHCISQQA